MRMKPVRGETVRRCLLNEEKGHAYTWLQGFAGSVKFESGCSHMITQMALEDIENAKDLR